MYEHCKEVIAYPCASDSAETPDLSDDSEDFDDDSDCIEPYEQTPASISRRSFLWDFAVGVTAGLAVGAVGEVRSSIYTTVLSGLVQMIP